MAGFAEVEDELRDADVAVVALVAEDEDEARGMKDDEDFGFPVLYGLDAEETAGLLGIETLERKGSTYMQPAQYILEPDGTVQQWCKGSGPVGRLRGREALDRIRSLKEKG